MKKIYLGITVDPEVAEELDKIEDRKKSQFVNTVLRKVLNI